MLTFRFAAADGAAPAERARALSFVMDGGVLAGVLGPQIVSWTMYLWPSHMFAVSYLAQAAVALVSMGVLLGVELPHVRSAATGGRPLAVIARQPRFVAAVSSGVITYLLMNFIMTSAPLAMRMCGLSQYASNQGLEWHVVAMYAPSFVTGSLITRFGAPRIVVAGLVLTGCAAATGLGGQDVTHFWLALVLLGLGWNLGFVGASALVLDCHRPEERTQVQALNDFLVFGTMVVGSFASGSLLTGYGWSAVCWVAFPLLTAAGLTLAATGALRRQVPT